MSVAHEHVGDWTVEDVLNLGEDTHQRIELVGGALLMSPSPTVPHQRASRRLTAMLDAAAEAARADVEVLETVNVLVPDGLLIPDIVVVPTHAAADAHLTINGSAVLLVVEIASPSTRVTDRKLKPQLYAAAGIPHYWRVELEPSPHLVVGRLAEGGYLEEPPVLAGGVVEVREPFPVRLSPGRLVTRG